MTREPRSGRAIPTGTIGWKTAAALFGVALLSSPTAADEVDDLLAVVKPPARFAGHAPDFSARPEEFAFQAGKGSIRKKVWAIRDGPRFVAVWHPLASKLYVVAADPARASRKIRMPPTYNDYGNTFDGKLGTRITTFPYCHGFLQKADKHTFAFTGGGKTLTLTDTSTWTRGRRTEGIYRVTFRCDPVLGYVVDFDIRFSTDQETDSKGRPFKPELLNLYPNHTFMRKMPDAGWRYEYTIYSPRDTRKYVAWINDFAQSDRADNLQVRNGGFCAFVMDPHGVGPALAGNTRDPIHFVNQTCNLQYDQHRLVTLPPKRAADGLYRLAAAFRLVFLPPEVTRYLLGRVVITDWRGNSAFAIRLGQVQGFEDASPAEKPAGKWGYRPLRLSDAQFRSGSRALELHGSQSLRVDTLPVLAPGTTYRLEAWAKVEGEGLEALLRAEPARWIPRGTKMEARRSASVEAGKGWQRVVLEFTNGPLGCTRWLYVAAAGSRRGKAWFDDVRITKIRPAAGGSGG